MTEDRIKIPLPSKQTANSYHMSEWQEIFKLIFIDSNETVKINGFSKNSVAFCRGFIISHISQDLGDLAESIRESKRDGITRYISSIFAWCFALSNELSFKLHDAIWNKYPGFCPYCGEPANCADAWWTLKQTEKGKKPKPQIAKDKDGNDKTPNQNPANFSVWVENFDNIYGRKYRIGMSISDIMYKLYEENAEVLEALDDLDFKNNETLEEVQSELADFVTWLFALIIKLDSYAFLKKEDIADYLFSKFENGCVRCEEELCICWPGWLLNESN